MKRIALALVSIAALAIVGCQPAEEAAPAPKGNKPDIIQAPPGAKNPEERAAENRMDKGPQDGGGQDGK